MNGRRVIHRWILIWAPATWLVLEMLTFPKDRPLSSGFANVLRGFVSPVVACYPAWFVWALAAVAAVAAIVVLRRRPVAARLLAAILTLTAVFAVWASAQMGWAALELTGRHSDWSWLFQTLALAAASWAVWAWADANPDRAQLAAGSLQRTWRLFRGSPLGMLGLLVLAAFAFIAIFAPFLANHVYLDAGYPVGKPFTQPAPSYYRLFGTDDIGLSVIAEFIWSARISLVVGLSAAIISTIIGAVVGIAAGFYGGWRSEVSMRTTDFFLVLPWLPLAMVLASAWGRSYGMLILIIGITSWPSTARVVRSETLRVRELQFIERAKAIGSNNVHMMARHVMPNVLPLIFANTVLVVAIAILSETTLSFLGLGDPLNFSWGTMLRNAWTSGGANLPAWWFILPPGVAIVLVVLGFTFVGRAFDSILDPKLRKREAAGAERIGEGSGRPWEEEAADAERLGPAYTARHTEGGL